MKLQAKRNEKNHSDLVGMRQDDCQRSGKAGSVAGSGVGKEDPLSALWEDCLLTYTILGLNLVELELEKSGSKDEFERNIFFLKNITLLEVRIH